MNISIYLIAAIVTAFAALYIKQIRPDYAMCVTLAGVVLLFSGVIPRITLLVNDIRTLSLIEGVSVSYITPMLKVVGISYIAQFTSDICADAGEKTLSVHVETIGKIAVVLIALPIVEDVFGMIIGLLE